MPENPSSSPAFVSLEDRAIQLRRAALQTRFRLAEQRAELEKIAASLSRARENVTAANASTTHASTARASTARASTASPSAAIETPLPMIRPAPAMVGALYGNGNKGTVPFVALPTALEATKRTVPAVIQALLPFVAIGVAAIVAHAKIAPRLAVVTPPMVSAKEFSAGRDGLLRLEPPAPLEDDGGAEALQLVHDWVPEGGDRSLLSLLGGEVDRPGLPPSWTVERTGPRSFLVRFRDGAVDHAFEADLEARSVRPAGEAVALFAGR